MSLLVWLVAPALACSLVPPEVFVLDPELVDDVAPESPELIDTSILRGRGPEKTLGGWKSSSCDDLGTVTIELAETDEDVGYRLRSVEGTLPDQLTLPDEPWVGPTLFLVWIDEAVDKQDPFDFVLEITAVDRAGNESAPLEIRLDDDGLPAPGEGGGCATGGAPVGTWTTLLGTLLVVTRRRR